MSLVAVHRLMSLIAKICSNVRFVYRIHQNNVMVNALKIFLCCDIYIAILWILQQINDTYGKWWQENPYYDAKRLPTILKCKSMDIATDVPRNFYFDTIHHKCKVRIHTVASNCTTDHAVYKTYTNIHAWFFFRSTKMHFFDILL